MQTVELKFSYKNCLEENIFLINVENGIDEKLLEFLSQNGKLKYTLGKNYPVFLVDSSNYFITGIKGENEMKLRIKEHKTNNAIELLEQFLQDLNKL